MNKINEIEARAKRKRIPLLSVESLKQALHYNPVTGFFTWRRDGKRAGSFPSVVSRKCGRYIRILVHGERYLAHRLAFLYMTGGEPPFELDHIDGNTMNNSWDNIRAVTQAENSRNRKLYVNNKSGISGVVFDLITENRWRAMIRVGGKLAHLGTHLDFFEACCARKSAEKKYGYHPNHGLLARK